MKTTTVVAAIMACAGLAAAAPSAEGVAARDWNQWKNDGPKGKECKKKQKSPFVFTSTYQVVARPEEVIATDQTPAPGQPGAIGYFNYGINAPLNTICYNITLIGVTGDYQSPARTATHIHQAPRGRAGPPRIAFPNPVADANNPNVRRSAGCLTGPFVTGIVTNGTDTGAGFTVSQIEANPANFFTDAHTTLFVPGVVRGQLA